MPNSMEQQFYKIVAQLPSKNIVIAYSGGIDSSVLLHLFHQVKDALQLSIKVIHINHQLSKSAQTWSTFCHKQADKLSLSYVSKMVDLEAQSKQGLESEARQKRYEAISSITAPNDIVCTAHHLDDQIETFFIRLFRGSGLHGLSSIRALRSFNQAWLARPLLGFSKQQLQDYAKIKKIQFITDESNSQNHFDRNYIRNELIPIIEARFPSYQKTIERSIKHIQTASFWLDEIAQQLLNNIKCDNKKIQLNPFYHFNERQQKAIIRSWLHENDEQQLNKSKLNNLILQLNNSDSLSINIGKYVLKKYQHHAYLVENKTIKLPQKRINWKVKKQPTIYLECIDKTINFNDLNLQVNEKDTVEIGFRQTGDKVYIKGVGQQSLKNFFQKKRIPPWQRNNIPLVYINNKLAKVCIS